MEERDVTNMAHQARPLEVFQGFKNHSRGNRTSTELTMLELLRKVYPDFSIVCIIPSNCDLPGYARARHASTTRESDEFFDATRM
jgi:transitional endoplasmic reticulum ATPase